MPGRARRNPLYDYAGNIVRRQEEEPGRIARTAAQQQAENTWHTVTWTTAAAGQPAPRDRETFQVITNPFIGAIHYEPDERIQPLRINAKPAKEVQAKDDYDIDAGD